MPSRRPRSTRFFVEPDASSTATQPAAPHSTTGKRFEVAANLPPPRAAIGNGAANPELLTSDELLQRAI